MMPEGLDPTAEAEIDAREEEPDRAQMTRALRDLEAAKARVERDAQQAADELRGKLVHDLIPVLDNLDRTIAAAEQHGESPAMIEGVQLVRGQLDGLLAKYGVERLEAKHRPFDPAIHDALSVVAVNHPSAHGVVVDQIQPGYKFGDRLLRPAKVVVGRYTPRYH
jgi:molecular chaperone GrpE (heat shock protein)